MIYFLFLVGNRGGDNSVIGLFVYIWEISLYVLFFGERKEQLIFDVIRSVDMTCESILRRIVKLNTS